MISITQLLFVLGALAPTYAVPPSFFVLLLDDMGWANVGFHSPNSTEVVTPNLDALAAEGVILERFYTHKFCAPSRCALQSGRHPIHVNVLNSPLNQHNPRDRVSGYMGIPRNFTGIAEKLKAANYSTKMWGKWDSGMAVEEQTPRGRGPARVRHVPGLPLCSK